FTGRDPLSTATDLVNTVDLLAAPADRLTVPQHLAEFLDGHGYRPGGVGRDELAATRRLREQLRRVWLSPDVDTAVERLNPLLSRHRAAPQLVREGAGWRLCFGGRQAPATAMAADLLGALAEEIVQRGVQ